MKRSHAAVALALTLLLALPGIAAADYSILEFESAVDALVAVDSTIDPPPNDPTRDFAVGGVRDSDGFNNGFSAHSDATGADVVGHLSATNPSITFFKHRMRAVCLTVSGNLAVIGLVSETRNSDVPFKVVVMRDGGPGGEADGFDSVSHDPYECDEPALLVLAAASDPIVNGDLLVHDAQPQP